MDTILGNYAVEIRRLVGEEICRSVCSFYEEECGRNFCLEKIARGWTRKHGFFFLMGGFMLYKNDNPSETLLQCRLDNLVEDGSISFPVFTKADIQHRSRSSQPLLLIYSLQVSWFFTQFFARLASHQPLAHLELVTLVVTVSNTMSLFFWWDKPQNVGSPIRVDPNSLSAFAQEQEPALLWGIYADESREQHIQYLAQAALMPASEKAKHPPTDSPKSFTFGAVREIITKLPITIYKYLVVKPVTFLYNDLDVLGMGNTGYCPSRALKVNRFYSGPGNSWGIWSNPCLPWISEAMGVLVGGVYIAGASWGRISEVYTAYSFPFFSSRVTVIWKVVSTMSAAVPVGILLLQGLEVSFDSLSFRFPSISTLDTLDDLFCFFGFGFIYITFLFFVIARLAVILLALISLTSIPIGVLTTAAWTNYLPHVS